jgi:hypothetical protein
MIGSASRKRRDIFGDSRVAERDVAREKDGRWKRGQSPNPAGRPAGVRNHATVLAEQLLEGEAEGVCRSVVAHALAGDMTAAKLVLDRILPPRKDRPVRIELPEIKTASDAAGATAGVLKRVAAGEVTPEEGARVVGLIDAFVGQIAAADFERRLAALEGRANG